jgi:hypothetical protein
VVTRSTRNGLIVAVLHVLIVASLGGKLLVDRATRPRVWARVAPVDPNLPIRGRYVQLRVEALPDRRLVGARNSAAVTLAAENGVLVARPGTGPNDLRAQVSERDGRRIAIVQQPLAYFIPEHVPDPSRRPPGEELWAEVTLPRRGAPRPIRLGVRKGGVLTPLQLR